MAPVAAGALEGAGVTAAPVLQVPMGTRAVGMGTAFTAVANDVSALHYNPAGLCALSYREASFAFLKGLDDQRLEHAAFGTPLPFSGLIGEGYSTLGASVLIAQHGTIEVNRTNPDGSFRDTRNIDAGGDIVATVAYAERAADTPIDRRGETLHIHHFMGVGAKFIRSTLAEQYSASAVAGDVGYLLKAPEMGWSAGLSLLNAGTRMTFIEQGDPLPLSARAGGAYQRALSPQHALTASADGDFLVHEKQWHVNAGVEYFAYRRLSVRAGYRFRHSLEGLTVGFGVHWAGFVLDYAWGMTSAVTDAHRFGLTYRFGKVPIRQREKPRRPYIESMPEREEMKGLEEERPRVIDRPRPPRQRPGEDRGVPGWIY